MNFYYLFLVLFISINALCQPNSKVYLYQGYTLKYKACIIAQEAGKKYYQFSKEYHLALDKVIEICPEFSYAYREKGSSYVKNGNFIEWKKLINKAVRYNPKDYLRVRASLRYKFLQIIKER